MTNFFSSLLSGRTKNVIMHGNSLVYSYGTATGIPSDPYSLTSLLAADLGALQTGKRNYAFLNKGHSGYNLAQLISLIDTDVRPYLDGNNDMNIVGLWEVINSLGAGYTDTQVYNSIVNYCTTVKAIMAVKIVVGTCLPVGIASGSWASGTHSATEAYRISVNNMIRNAISPPWDAIADMQTNSNIGAVGAYSNSSFYISDNVHLNSNGYVEAEKVWRQAIFSL